MVSAKIVITDAYFSIKYRFAIISTYIYAKIALIFI